jgi:hypothetical protein
MLPSVVPSLTFQLLMLLFASQQSKVLGKKSSSSVDIDPTVYGMSLQRDWLDGAASTVAMKYEGCVWGYAGDRENMGCMADESGDGTTYWYMMANCRRAQVAYSVYASSGSTSCNKKDFKETFVTTNGVAEFAYTMGTYGYNSPISSSDVSSLPMCEYDGNGYYYGVGCSSSGTFTIDRFSDAYCTQYYDTYDKLSNLNSALKSLSKCYYIYSTKTDEDPTYSLATYVINESTSCSSAEHELCITSEFVANSASYASKQKTSSTSTQKRSNLSKLTDKLKYTLGTAFLCGSAIMFVGILFTNRKKRRAMMHGKLKSKSDSSKSKSRSKSRSSSQKQRSSSSSKKKKSSSSAGVAALGGGTFA